MATNEETKAAEQKAAAEKEKSQTAKELLNVPAPPKNATATQANGNNDKSVTFDLPPNLPPAPGNKPTILHENIRCRCVVVVFFVLVLAITIAEHLKTNW